MIENDAVTQDDAAAQAAAQAATSNEQLPSSTPTPFPHTNHPFAAAAFLPGSVPLALCLRRMTHSRSRSAG